MDAVKFMREKERMCNTHLDCASVKCFGCPADRLKGGCGSMICIEEMVLTVEKWSADHPQKTRAMDFFDKFPNAPKYEKDQPQTCAKSCGYIVTCDGKCSQCWNMPMEETK